MTTTTKEDQASRPINAIQYSVYLQLVKARVANSQNSRIYCTVQVHFTHNCTVRSTTHRFLATTVTTMCQCHHHYRQRALLRPMYRSTKKAGITP